MGESCQANRPEQRRVVPFWPIRQMARRVKPTTIVNDAQEVDSTWVAVAATGSGRLQGREIHSENAPIGRLIQKHPATIAIQAEQAAGVPMGMPIWRKTLAWQAPEAVR